MTYINDAIVLKEAYDWDHPCSHAEAAGRPAGMRGHLRRCRIKILPDRPMEPVRECFIRQRPVFEKFTFHLSIPNCFSGRICYTLL